MRVMLLLCALLFFLIPTTRAQETDPDTPINSTITYNETVQATITEEAFFDRWTFNAAQGDIVVAIMIASDGLAPLLGLGTIGGELLYATDGFHEDRRVDAEPNTQVEIEYRIAEAGQYVMIATRAGRDEGTTTGSYTLSLRRANNDPGRPDMFQDVVFRCGEDEVTTALTVEWFQESGETYRVRAYGLDGFRPLLRLQGGPMGEINDCSADSQMMGGDSFILPGEAAATLPAENPPDAAALDLSAGLDDITLTVGSIDGAGGRYLLVIDGFQIMPERDPDLMTVRLGPLARETALLAYMVRTGSSRLDPVMTWLDFNDQPIQTCDDAGRRGCESVAAFTGAGVTLNDGTSINGARLDAGLLLQPGNADPILVEFTNRNRDLGGYAVILIGTLPAGE
jgi:hypothetical protein